MPQEIIRVSAHLLQGHESTREISVVSSYFRSMGDPSGILRLPNRFHVRLGCILLHYRSKPHQPSHRSKERLQLPRHPPAQRAQPHRSGEPYKSAAETCLRRVYLDFWGVISQETHCVSIIWNGFRETFFSCTSLLYINKLVKKTRSIISSTLSGCAHINIMTSSVLSATGWKLWGTQGLISCGPSSRV